MRACKSFARWSADFEDRVRDLSDDILELWYFRMLAVKRAATSARRENSVLAFTLGGFHLFTSLITSQKNQGHHFQERHRPLWHRWIRRSTPHILQGCDRKVRPLGDIIIRAQMLSIKIFIFSSATRATVWRSLIWNATERATKLSSTSIASTTFSYRWSSDIFKKYFLSLKWPWVRSSASEICGIWLRDDSSPLELLI